MSAPFDPTDPAQLRRLLVNLRVAVDDAHEVARDMLRPRRKRRLGHVEHSRLYLEAHGSLISLLNYALGGEPGSGDPGAGEVGPPLQ